MMLRVGWVYGLSFVAGAVVAIAWLALMARLLGKDEKNWAHRFGLVKLSMWFALILIIAVPMYLTTMAGNYVWVIDEGNEFRRYILYGTQGTAETLDGKPVEFEIGTGRVVETVVNCTHGPILIETLQYGGVIKHGPDSRHRVEAGKSFGLDGCVDDVRDPPASIEATGGIGIKTFVHQLK